MIDTSRANCEDQRQDDEHDSSGQTFHLHKLPTLQKTEHHCVGTRAFGS
jgi:hypothetical protein